MNDCARDRRIERNSCVVLPPPAAPWRWQPAVISFTVPWVRFDTSGRCCFPSCRCAEPWYSVSVEMRSSYLTLLQRQNQFGVGGLPLPVLDRYIMALISVAPFTALEIRWISETVSAFRFCSQTSL